MGLKTITVNRYVTPLREGGSLPAIIEADDEGLYVLKFRGAGQGAKVLIAEVVAGELARIAGLDVPEIALALLDVELARTEPDPEIQNLIRASGGLNIALDYLPGSITFDPLSHPPDPALASRIVWFDAFMMNVDRTVRNSNMLMWHRKLWLIDHGAALYFHYAWAGAKSAHPFPLVKDHVLLRFAKGLEAAHDFMRRRITPAQIDAVVELIPDQWLKEDESFKNVESHRDAYREFFKSRLDESDHFLKEAQRASEDL